MGGESAANVLSPVATPFLGKYLRKSEAWPLMSYARSTLLGL